MHNNDRYFETVNSQKFQFYSQLIERYRNSIITSKTNYLLLKSSNIKNNEHLKIGKTIKIINNSIIFNEILEHAIAMKERSSFEYEHVIFVKSENLIESNQATDGIIEAKDKHSIITSQSLRSTIQTESMSINLRGETIPMAYSSFLDIWNDKQENTINYPSSNILRFGKEVEDENRNNSNQMRKVMKQLHRKNEKHLTKNQKQSVKKFETKKSYHFSNQLNLLKMNNSYSILLALPSEIYLSENMSINLRGETIPMVCSCFLDKSRSIQQVDSVYLIRKFKLKHLLRSGKLRRREIVILIWLDGNMNWKYLKEKEDKF
jgi:hypothetical protein